MWTLLNLKALLNKWTLVGLGFLATVLTVVTFGKVKKSEGAKEVVAVIAKQEATKEQEAVKKTFKEKKRVTKLSDIELQERIDDRTNRWANR